MCANYAMLFLPNVLDHGDNDPHRAAQQVDHDRSFSRRARARNNYSSGSPAINNASSSSPPSQRDDSTRALHRVSPLSTCLLISSLLTFRLACDSLTPTIGKNDLKDVNKISLGLMFEIKLLVIITCHGKHLSKMCLEINKRSK